ncbi:MAG TPA: uroporphyrinogen decarboxylase family protein [Armatimonadota bacterium]|jgi:uroporphyrinogen decarboxylase
MTSREIVQATLQFQGPERLARDTWILPIAFQGRQQEMDALLARHPGDIAHVTPPGHLFHIPFATKGEHQDIWGCSWLVLQDGMVGEVKRSPLEDYRALAGYEWPLETLRSNWVDPSSTIAAKRDTYLLGFVGALFERMQFLRGSQNLYEDLADEECSEVYELRDQVARLMHEYLDRWLLTDVDAVYFADDWGSQRSLLISPRKWREFFKPVYKSFFDKARAAGKAIFMHSDGYIAEIYPDFIELGVTALNSQVWCMGLDTLEQYAGKITFWGELDRQHLLPHGTPAAIHAAAQAMMKHCYRNGGLIGQCSIEQVWHTENVAAALSAWDELLVVR